MLRALRLFSLFVGVMILSIVAITAFLSPDFLIEREIEIEAERSLIFDYIADLKKWEEWSPWLILDPEMVITYSDQRRDEGAFYYWNGEPSGEGKLTLLAVEPNETVHYQMEFRGFEQMVPTGIIQIESISESTHRIVWIYKGTVGDEYFMRWFAFFSESRLSPVVDDGLEQLKEVVERNSKPNLLTPVN